jgi:hypothetical protein
MREVVLAGRRAGLIHGGRQTRTSAAEMGKDELLGPPPAKESLSPANLSGDASRGMSV